MSRSLLPIGAAVVSLLVLPIAAIAFSHRPAGAAPATAIMPPGSTKGRETGLPVPRYVSLKSGNARMRIGPSFDYGTKWIYLKAGLPLEITAEYDNWRQVRDPDGIAGWMHRILLSSRRSAVVGPWLKAPVALRAGASAKSPVTAKLAASVLLDLDGCDGSWCAVEVKGRDVSGFVRQSNLWGVYPSEVIR
ncbi:SH3 domain-containing protein [Rhizobiaceae bacterium n13]|uniref:SH3 domain-containing protein n=1 Tax=Ferirhizobium litorale TaxID=2927786 RepID=A0AAE3Q7L9_9HYPH|nr:SH3 domain-containing protein [Fererhizobium litorale]MDI7860574.1 SH3 domain-containing protein [Fererhizobium litorale]MDI7920722.1 SH3 domain-containing protein [Fererhizobium litorale]